MNIPQALFPCSNTWCSQEVSYHADQLYWYEAGKKWVCEYCWDELPADEGGNSPSRGISLMKHITAVNPLAVALLGLDAPKA